MLPSPQLSFVSPRHGIVTVLSVELTLLIIGDQPARESHRQTLVLDELIHACPDAKKEKCASTMPQQCVDGSQFEGPIRARNRTSAKHQFKRSHLSRREHQDPSSDELTSAATSIETNSMINLEGDEAQHEQEYEIEGEAEMQQPSFVQIMGEPSSTNKPGITMNSIIASSTISATSSSVDLGSVEKAPASDSPMVMATKTLEH